ncbi:PREDICTED: uncharacterized protein LOC106911245 [Poecilia mexicana]|uniref:uncharacterized protein LOC106911245 n=1 Tax=Poecilia mexicana TaxID=48701 RepID=UPI00072DFE7C|nr:PREDICTED: uncharacterized protein LOC106911245 [Poecilia mexicana]
MFSGETITLTCEVQGGETTEWTCEWRRPGLATHRTNSKDWTFIVSQSSSGDYLCQCKLRDDWYSSTQRSNAITLSVSGKPKAQLDRNNAELPPGGRVTLTCTVNSLSSFSYTSSSSSAWKYVWYRGENCSELLTGEEAVFPSNGEINVSEEGLYWCRGKRGQPVYYTILSDPISIVLPVTVSSQLPVMLIIGIIIGIVLIILLILWWRYRRSKHSCCISFFQSESSGQTPATDHGVNRIGHAYMTLLHVTTSIYHTLHPCGAAGHDESQAVKCTKREDK